MKPTDRRSNIITITSQGRDTRARVQQRIDEGEDELLRLVSSSTRTKFLHLAAEVNDGMRRRT